MAIRPFIRPVGGATIDNLYLPEVDPGASQLAGSKDIPAARIPLQDGETVYGGGITLRPEIIRMGGTFRRGVMADNAAMWAAIEAFLAAIKARSAGEASRICFGRRNTETGDELYNEHAYVTAWNIGGEPGLPYHEWEDVPWNIDMEIKRPDLWQGALTPPGEADDDEVIIRARGRVVIVVEDAVLFKNSAGAIRAQLTASDGRLRISGDYGFLP